MAAPLVSIIVPCFNAGPMLAPALRSIIEQTYPSIEIVFVDNGSTDDSLEAARQILQTQARPFEISPCPDRGANHARNWGYRLARGDYIQWVDADDRLDADKIARQVEALEGNPDRAIAYGDWTAHRIEPGKPRADERHDLRQVEDQVHRTLAGIWYPPHLYLLRRAIAEELQEARAWWPGRPVATDVEYSAIAALRGARFLYVAGAHVHYNIWSSGQISGGTPYRARAAALEAIFKRLREFVDSGQAGVALTRRHRILLDQNWRIWKMPPGSAVVEKLPGRRFRLKNARSGKAIEVRPREAAIATALMAGPAALTTCHLALMLTESPGAVADDPAIVVETLERFQREGFMEAIA